MIIKLDCNPTKPAIFIANLLLLIICLLPPVKSLGDITYLVPNSVFYDIVKDSDDRMVKEWLIQLQAAIANCVSIILTARLTKVLVNRARMIKWKVKKMTGSAKKKQYLQLLWEFKVEAGEITPQANKENNRTIATSSHTRKRQYSQRHERRLKRQRTDQCLESLSWLENKGFKPLKVVVQDQENSKIETIMLHEACNEPGHESDERTMNILNMTLYLKDMFSISGAAYHEMARLFQQMPRHYKLKEKITELNRMWNIKPLPNGVSGVQQSLKERLLLCAEKLHDNTPDDAPFKATRTLRVKLSGDGTKIGKRLHVVNFTFVLLDEGDLVYKYEGNHSLAIMQVEEKYAKLKLALQDIIEEVKQLGEMIIRGDKYKVKFFLGGDWKFLAVVTGIDAATSEYSCIWCTCPKSERHDMEKRWGITRSVEENTALATQRRGKRYNVSNHPMFETIPIRNVVIDNLHLFLRVTDVLINLLVTELKRQDAIDKLKVFHEFKTDKYEHCVRYQSMVSSLGIPDYQFYIGKTSKQLKLRTLTGPEKLKLLAHIKISDLLPKYEPQANIPKIQTLWTSLLDLNKTFSKRPEQLSEENVADFEVKARSWVDLFLTVYHTGNVTPYIHAMANHVPEFLKLHGSILPFTQQGLEKYNDIITKTYFRSTNHQGCKAFCQIMEKQNRLEYFNGLGLCPTKCFAIKCQNCLEEGHNRKTCTKPCKKCGHSPYSTHLITVDKHSYPSCNPNDVHS